MQIKTALTALLMLHFVVGCGPQSVSSTLERAGRRVKGNGDSGANAAKPKEIAPAAAPTSIQKTLRGGIQGLVKSTRQLSAAIENCVGPSKLKIESFMIVDPGKASVGNINAFLSLPLSNVGKNILSIQAASMDGDSRELATSVRTANLNFTYLSALRNVGNVAAVNCVVRTADPAAPKDTHTPVSPLCSCATEPQAMTMLARCLPHVPSDKLKSFAPEFAAACGKDPLVAISSLIGSAQFSRFD